MKRSLISSAVAITVGLVVTTILLTKSAPRVVTTYPGLLTDPYVNVLYPPEWKTTLQAAASNAAFTPLVPNTTLASAENLVAVYLWPQGQAVAMDFPAPVTSSSSPVRQEFLEVYEEPWTKGDPLASFETDIAAAPVAGKDVYYIGSGGTIPALVVTPRSSSNVGPPNAAYLRFVVGGTEVEVSGGESLQDLIDIANSMLPPQAGPSAG